MFTSLVVTSTSLSPMSLTVERKKVPKELLTTRSVDYLELLGQREIAVKFFKCIIFISKTQQLKPNHCRSIHNTEVRGKMCIF